MAHKCDAALHFGMHSPLFPLCLLLTLCCTSCQVTDQEATAKQAAHDSKAPEWSLAIHGGAGHFDTEVLSDEQQAAYRTSLQAALEVGGSVLEQGGTAVDAVVATIEVLEDDSLFNAGRGAVLTYEGKHELDASIMDGSDRNCGAITGLSGYRHPISVARQVMTESEHVFFSGPGAAEFAATQGAEEAEEDWFMTRKAMVRTPRCRHLHGRDDVQAPWPHRGQPCHRSGHLGRRSDLRHIGHRLGRVFHTHCCRP
jgi:beta-aspartyl-peptidase (threonine type)